MILLLLLLLLFIFHLLNDNRFVGDFIINKKYRKLNSFFKELNDIKGFRNNTSLLLYKENKCGETQRLQLNRNCFEEKIGNGEIICFQKKIKGEE